MGQNDIYSPEKFNEKELMVSFRNQRDDAKSYFENVLRPRLDRWYKLYIAYTGDRKKEIKSWQANVFVPYIQAVVETLVPRILDARPDFTAMGRSQDDQLKAEKQQQLQDYFWEIAKMDTVMEDLSRSAMIYGTGFLQVSWKKDERLLKFLASKDPNSKKYTWKEQKKTFYDAPFCENVDPYSLWYDWHNTAREDKQYWFKRRILSEDAIRRRYPSADETRLSMSLRSRGSLDDYASIRTMVKSTHSSILRGADYTSSGNAFSDKYQDSIGDKSLLKHEVFEWWRPSEDAYAVMVNDVPIFDGGFIPIPFDFKETPFIDVPYLRVPNEFEGYGIPAILEQPQIMLNMIKNQRLDSATMSIHKMWIVNPIANVSKEQLVTRPFGIVYSTDPAGVREVQFSDIKQSAYREEDLLKADMRYASGIDDSSMGVGGSGASATEVRHLRESTLERVRLFVNHLGDACAHIMRYWMSLQRQFFTKEMNIRILGADGKMLFPIISKDDLDGTFDYKATVLPSIAGQAEIKKKQNMDLVQLLINLPFVDPEKLISKVLSDGFTFSLENIKKEQQAQPGMPGMEGQQGELPPGAEGMDPNMMAQMAQQQGGGGSGALMDMSAMLGRGAQQAAPSLGTLDPQALAQALALLGRSIPSSGGFDASSQFGEASMPINLASAPPPTVRGVPKQSKANPRGMNRTGKVNTNVSQGNNSNPEAALMSRASSIQR